MRFAVSNFAVKCDFMYREDYILAKIYCFTVMYMYIPKFFLISSRRSWLLMPVLLLLVVPRTNQKDSSRDHATLPNVSVLRTKYSLHLDFSSTVIMDCKISEMNTELYCFEQNQLLKLTSGGGWFSDTSSCDLKNSL